MEEKDIKPKKVEGKITILQTMPYKGSWIYIRKIGEEIFEYLTVFDGQIYGDYMMLDLEGKKKATQKQIVSMGTLMFTAATTTIDEIIKLKTEQLMTAPITKTPKNDKMKLKN